MIPGNTKLDLTAAERRMYRALRRDIPVDTAHEARTIASLRKQGFFGASGDTCISPKHPKGNRRRAVAMLGAAAAVVVAAVSGSILVRRAHAPIGRANAAVASEPSSPRHRSTEAPEVAVSNARNASSASYLVWY